MRRPLAASLCVTIGVALFASAFVSAQEPEESLRQLSMRPAGPDQAPVQARAEKDQAPSTPGSTQGRARRRSSRQRTLNLTANAVGGYDDNVGAALTSGSSSVPAAATNGSTAFADAMLEYSRENPRHGITVRTLGSLQAFPGYLDEPAGAGKARFTGFTRIGVKNMVRFSTQVRYEPFFTPGVIEETGRATSIGDPGAVASEMAIGEARPTTLLERRSFVSSNKAYLERNWTSRDRTVASYLFFAQRTVSGGVGDDYYHQAALDYSRRLSRTSGLHGSYEYVNGAQSSGDVTLPNSRHTIEAGPEFSKTLSRKRPLSVRFSGGATYVQTLDYGSRLPLDAWMPAGSGSASIGLTRSWVLHGAYGRGFSMLQGLTNELYSTGSANLSLSGRLNTITSVDAGGTFANGRMALGHGNKDTFNLYGGTLNVQITLSSTVAATVGYFLYFQDYSNPAALPPGFPAHYRRNALSVGLTLFAPLAGNMPVRPRGPAEW